MPCSCPWCTEVGSKIDVGGWEIAKRGIFPWVVAVGCLFGLLACTNPTCTNPYDPVQRTIGGGLIGTGSGAAIGAAAAGGHGAALRARHEINAQFGG